MPSSCCQAPLVCETVWLLTAAGRQAIGEVVICGKYSCHRVIGDLKSGDRKIPASSWAHMLRIHPRPPFYFKDDGGQMIPETTPIQAPIGAQDRAANDYEEPPF